MAAPIKPRVLVLTLDEVPVARSLLAAAVPLSPEARGWVHFFLRQDDRELAAKVVGANLEQPEYGVWGPTPTPATRELLADTAAMNQALASVLAAEMKTEADGDATIYLTAGFDPAMTLATATAAFTKAGFEVMRYAEMLHARLGVEERAAALARVTAAFEEHLEEVDPKVAAALLRFARAEATALPARELEALKREGGEPRAAVVYAITCALSGEAERWDPEISGRLLDLWIAVREPLEHLEHLGLGQTLQREAGANRARLLAEALEQRGLAAPLAVQSGLDVQGDSPGWESLAALARPEVLIAAVGCDRTIARELAWRLLCLLDVWLREAPTAQRRLTELLTASDARTEALSIHVLLRALDTSGALAASLITREHLSRAPAGGDLEELFRLGMLLEQAAPAQQGMWRFACELGVQELRLDLEALRRLERVLERSPEVVVREAAWERLVTLIEQAPEQAGAPREEDQIQAVYHVVDDLMKMLKAPPKAVKARLAALCASRARELGPALELLQKRAGTYKPVPAPYDDGALADLPAPLAKAWRTAREKSWKAGITLPAGASRAALDQAEQTLGAKLPVELRSFYELHDGAGPDEVFRGCRLYAIRECLERRAWLLEVKGRPFDPAWLPITDDGAGNHGCVVLAGKNAGTIVDFDHEVGGGRLLSKSFAAYVQGARWGE